VRIGRRDLLKFAGAALAAPAVSSVTWAQSYPTRPVRIIVGFPAGGTTDIAARLVGRWLSEHLGQQFVVENRPGAATNIATQAAVRAPADGHTLLLVTMANVVNTTLYEKLNFNFIRDISPVASLMRTPLVLEVIPAMPVKTVAELIAYAKANPGKITMASFGNGSISHLSAELFKMTTGSNFLHVPYRGSAPMLTDLLGGQVQAAFDNVPASLEHIRTGKLRALAVTTAARSEALPDTPTIGEFLAGFEVSALVGLGVPRGTPIEIIERLNREINMGLASPTIRAAISELGGAVVSGSQTDYGNMLRSETEKWAKVIKFAGMKPD
jgi:tripartite-type tricarboxylate transporter receptor subunit TctC